MILPAAYPKVTHYRVWQLAWPMILANMAVPMATIVDSAIAGHISLSAIGAIAIASIIFSFISSSCSFLRMGITGLAAQLDDHHGQQAGHILSSHFMLAFAIALTLLLLQSPISHYAFSLFSTSSTVMELAQDYFRIRLYSIPAVLCQMVILGWLIGLGKSHLVFYLVVMTSSINIALSFITVFLFDYGITGIAIATIIADYCGLAIGLIIIHRTIFSLSHLKHHWCYWPQQQLFHLHSPLFIRTLCLLLVFAFFTQQSAQQSDIVLAANTLLLHFITFSSFFLDGFANAAEVITGQAMRHRSRAEFKRGIYYILTWAVATAVILAVVYGLFASTLLTLMTSSYITRYLAEHYLIWIIMAPLISVLSYSFDGVYIGATQAKAMCNTVLLATIAVYLPTWYYLQPFYNHGLWAALSAFLLARGLLLLADLPRLAHHIQTHR